MKIEKAVYSESALVICEEAVKATRFHVDKRAEHFSKWAEVSRLFDLCWEQLNHCMLFEQSASYGMCEYTRLVNQMVDKTGKPTKKVLDKALKDAGNHLKWELASFRTDILRGEIELTI